jgi:hypothetical protein
MHPASIGGHVRQGKRRPGREVYHTAPCNSDAKNNWNYTLHGVHTVSFTFPYLMCLPQTLSAYRIVHVLLQNLRKNGSAVCIIIWFLYGTWQDTVKYNIVLHHYVFY